MPEDRELEDRLVTELREEAAKRGFDPDLIEEEDVEAERVGKDIHVKWMGVEIKVPAPSPVAMDAWFDKYGGVIVGSVLTLVAVAVGGKIANNGKA